MLRVYGLAIEALRELRGTLAQIERRDADLGRQMRRAAVSIALNVAEGCGCRGGNQRLRFETALGSAKETLGCVDAALALYEIDAGDGARKRLDHVIAILFKLSR